MEFTKAWGVLWAWVVEETIDGFCGSYKDPGLSTLWELPSNYDEMAGEIAALVQKMGASATATVLQDAAVLKKVKAAFDRKYMPASTSMGRNTDGAIGSKNPLGDGSISRRRAFARLCALADCWGGQIWPSIWLLATILRCGKAAAR